MVEVHINPKMALSDAEQQITPEEFGSLIKNLRSARPTMESKEVYNNIDHLQEEMETIDHKIIELVAMRADVKKKIAIYKKKNNISLIQNDQGNGKLRSRIKAGIKKTRGDL